MAQINITLNQDEILQLLKDDRNECFRKLLENTLNSILKVESTKQLKAEPYERSEERTDSRNGFRERELNTRIGKITLKVPRHRNQPFKTLIFDNYSRSEGALVTTMAEMVASGVSTRKVSKVIETLCGTKVSKSSVSEVCKTFDADVSKFRNRPLEESYPFMMIDATYFKVRLNGRVVSRAFMIAYATNAKGLREILGFNVYRNESEETWTDFLLSLKNRGLSGLMMITSDAHDGMIRAISKVFPDVPWQRCQFHFSKNISEKTPKKYQAGLRAELQEMYNCDTIEQSRRKRDQIIDDYSDVAESAMKTLDEGFEDAMTVMALPKTIRRLFRTSNKIERLNRELKRRSDVIGVFSNDESLLRLMGVVLIEENEKNKSAGKATFSENTYRMFDVSSVKDKLHSIAEEQRNLLKAL